MVDYKGIVKKFLTQELLYGHNLVALKDDEDLLLSGLVDSLGVVRLIAYIESELGLYVPPEDVLIENFSTINAISAYLENLHRLKAAG